MGQLRWEIAPTSELTNGMYTWFARTTTDGVCGFEIAEGSRGWGVAFRGGDDKSWYIPALDGLSSMVEATEAAEVLYETLVSLKPGELVAREVPVDSTSDEVRTALMPVVIDTDGDGIAFVMDERFWATPLISENERFDLLDRGDGSLLLRACPHDIVSFRAAHFAARHDDEAFTEGSHCGLTKWTCIGCKGATIVETEDQFPEGWLEICKRRGNGDTLAYEVVCSMACLVEVGATEPQLRATRIPGFDAETS